MTPEEHVKLARRLFEDGWNRGNVDLIVDCVGANYVNYDPALPEPVRGIAAMKQTVQGYLTAFPDLKFVIDEAHAVGAYRTLLRWTASGTQRGELMGIPPTGRAGRVTGLTLSRFEGGKIVEDHMNWDTLGLLRQLGVIPEQQPTKDAEQRPSAQ